MRNARTNLPNFKRSHGAVIELRQTWATEKENKWPNTILNGDHIWGKDRKDPHRYNGLIPEKTG